MAKAESEEKAAKAKQIELCKKNDKELDRILEAPSDEEDEQEDSDSSDERVNSDDSDFAELEQMEDLHRKEREKKAREVKLIAVDRKTD